MYPYLKQKRCFALVAILQHTWSCILHSISYIKYKNISCTLVKNEIWVPFGKQMYSNKYKTHRVIATTQIHT